MTESTWRAQRNAKALARLQCNLPEIFPAPVLRHALARPFVPPTPRRAIEAYWREHPIRAEKLARALASLSSVPAGWAWQVDVRKSPLGFRAPPAPFREQTHVKVRAIAACAGRRCSGLDGIAICGATSVRTRTRAGMPAASRPGSFGRRRATTFGTCGACRSTAVPLPAGGSAKTRRSITACHCSRSGAMPSGPGGRDELGPRC